MTQLNSLVCTRVSSRVSNWDSKHSNNSADGARYQPPKTCAFHLSTRSYEMVLLRRSIFQHLSNITLYIFLRSTSKIYIPTSIKHNIVYFFANQKSAISAASIDYSHISTATGREVRLYLCGVKSKSRLEPKIDYGGTRGL